MICCMFMFDIFMGTDHGPTRETALARTKKLKRMERISKKNEGEWTWTVEFRTQKKFLAVGEACVAMF